MSAPPNSNRTFLEQYFGRKVRTQTQESLVAIPQDAVAHQIVGADPKRIKLHIATSANAGSNAALASDQDLLSAGDGYSLATVTPLILTWIDDLDDVTSAWFAYAGGAQCTLYVRELILVGLLEP